MPMSIEVLRQTSPLPTNTCSAIFVMPKLFGPFQTNQLLFTPFLFDRRNSPGKLCEITGQAL